MAAGDDMTDWAQGQPPPWLAAYGPVPPPIDSALAGAPGAPVPPVATPPLPELQPGLGVPAFAVDAAAGAMQRPAPTGAPGVPPPFDSSIAGAPGAPSAQPAVPPWLQGPAPGPPAPDAITGAEGSAPAADARNAKQDLARIAADRAQGDAKTALDPNAPVSDRQSAWQRIPPSMRIDIVNSGDPNALAAIANPAMDPEELATIANRHEMARLHEDSTQRLELARKSNEAATAAFQAHQAAVQKATADTAQVDVDAKRLAMEKLDPNEHGVGHFIATVLLSAVGGAVSQYTGGRNLALEEFDKRTQQRIDAQKADIENQWKGIGLKRNIIAEQLQQSGDLFRAQETYRISQYDRAAAELQTKMQDYDPQGTTAIKGAMQVQAIQAARGQALQAFAQKTSDNHIAAAKVDFEARKAALEAQQKQAQLDLDNTKSLRETGLGYSRIASEDKRAKDELAEKRADRLDKKDLAAQKDWDERGLGDPSSGEPFVSAEGEPLLKKARDLEAAGKLPEARALRDEAASKYGIKAGSKEEAPKLQQAMAFTQSMSDKLAMIKAKLDADPSFTDRAAWGGIASWVEGLKIDEIKALGMNPSSRELEALKEQFGESPEEFDARLRVTGGQQKLRAKLDAAQQALSQDIDAELKAAKVNHGWQPRALTSYKPTPTDADLLEKQALAADVPEDKKSGTQKATDVVDKIASTLIPGFDQTQDVLSQVAPGYSVRGNKVENAAASRKAAIEQLARQAESAQDPNEAAKYVAALSKIERAGDVESAKLAAALLDKYHDAHLPAAPNAGVVYGTSDDSTAAGDETATSRPE